MSTDERKREYYKNEYDKRFKEISKELYQQAIDAGSDHGNAIIFSINYGEKCAHAYLEGLVTGEAERELLATKMLEAGIEPKTVFATLGNSKMMDKMCEKYGITWDMISKKVQEKDAFWWERV